MKKLSELSGTFVTHRRRDHCRGCLRDIDIHQIDTNKNTYRKVRTAQYNCRQARSRKWCLCVSSISRLGLLRDEPKLGSFTRWAFQKPLFKSWKLEIASFLLIPWVRNKWWNIFYSESSSRSMAHKSNCSVLIITGWKWSFRYVSGSSELQGFQYLGGLNSYNHHKTVVKWFDAPIGLIVMLKRLPSDTAWAHRLSIDFYF